MAKLNQKKGNEKKSYFSKETQYYMHPNPNEEKSQKLPWVKPEIVEIKVHQEAIEAYYNRLLDEENFHKLADSGGGNG